MKLVKVFFDASVLFAALYSKTGASNKLLELVQEEFCIGITSETIVTELENNLHKLPVHIKLDDCLAQSGLKVRQAIAVHETELWLDKIEPKDAHVVAGAILTGCDYLVTLDKKHLNNPTIQQHVNEVEIIAPKELLYKLAN